MSSPPGVKREGGLLLAVHKVTSHVGLNQPRAANLAQAKLPVSLQRTDLGRPLLLARCRAASSCLHKRALPGSQRRMFLQLSQRRGYAVRESHTWPGQPAASARYILCTCRQISCRQRGRSRSLCCPLLMQLLDPAQLQRVVDALCIYLLCIGWERTVRSLNCWLRCRCAASCFATTSSPASSHEFKVQK